MNSLDFLIADLPEDVNNLICFGEFQKAVRLIDIYLSRNISNTLKQRLSFEKYRLDVLKNEYIYTFEGALDLAQEKIEGFTRQELQELKDQRYADWIFIEGKVMFSKRFLDNIIKVHPTIKERLRIKEIEDEVERDFLDDTIKEIIEKGEKNYFIHLKTCIKIKNEYARINDVVRVHLPIPQKAQQIANINILNTSHTAKFISPETYPQRTIFFEEQLKENESFTAY